MSGIKKKKTPRLSQSFQRGLLIVVIIAFAMTTVMLWFLQTNLAEKNAVSLMKLNLADVQADIRDASDEHLLDLTRQIAQELNEASLVSRELLHRLALHYNVTEISCIDPQGVITVSTNADFIGFDMHSGAQAAEFLVLLEDEQEYVQPYQPITYDASIQRKYAGAVLADGGFVQVGYGAARFQQDIDEFVVGVTRNRHVGEGGCIIIVDEDWNIVSDRHNNEGQNLDVTGIWIDTELEPEGEVFRETVYGERCYCMHMVVEGYRAVAVLPEQEAALSRNVSVGVTTAMQIVVFAALFVMIYILINRLIVRNIYQINNSLGQITEGDLDTVVNVRSHVEFEDLSNDINSTVDTLKRYIADAAARIDAELAFAKAIQHSALPSVFPPYPHRGEFSLWATMHTAKEVGGDFYDFYFVDDDHLVFLVADVSGKGIPAAMFMMTAKTLLKSYAEAGLPVDEVFTRANEELCANNDAGMFVTAWMGCLNVKTGELTYANAGHNPPLVKQADGEFAYLKERTGFVLAGMEGIRYRKKTLLLQPGDQIYLYTDGVTEAVDPENRLYGEERLTRVLHMHCSDTSQAICAAVKADVDQFAGTAEQFDDITMLSLQYHGEQIRSLTLPATLESIGPATAFVDEILESLDCPIKAQTQIDIAMDELLSNIANYAYGPAGGEVTVQVSLQPEPRAVQITLIDDGKPYDPLQTAEPDITLGADERPIGGLGIFMVKKTMDDLSYVYRDGQNRLTFIKQF